MTLSREHIQYIQTFLKSKGLQHCPVADTWSAGATEAYKQYRIQLGIPYPGCALMPDSVDDLSAELKSYVKDKLKVIEVPEVPETAKVTVVAEALDAELEVQEAKESQEFQEGQESQEVQESDSAVETSTEETKESSTIRLPKRHKYRNR